MPADKLVALVLSLYAGDEIRPLAARRWPTVLSRLPQAGGAPRVLAEALVAGWVDQGRVEEAFEVFREERPWRHADIDGVAALWAGGLDPARSARGRAAEAPADASPGVDVVVLAEGEHEAAAAHLEGELRAHPVGLRVRRVGCPSGDLVAAARDALGLARVVAVFVSDPPDLAGGGPVDRYGPTEGERRVVPIWPGGPHAGTTGGISWRGVGATGAAAQLVMLSLRLRSPMGG